MIALTKKTTKQHPNMLEYYKRRGYVIRYNKETNAYYIKEIKQGIDK